MNIGLQKFYKFSSVHINHLGYQKPQAIISMVRVNRPTHRDSALLALLSGRRRRSWALAKEKRCSLKTSALHVRRAHAVKHSCISSLSQLVVLFLKLLLLL